MPATFSKSPRQPAKLVEPDQVPEFGDSRDLRKGFRPERNLCLLSMETKRDQKRANLQISQPVRAIARFDLPAV
jgi:hypothetical protein